MSDLITSSVEVDVPVRTAYNQWTQFEEFPRFMEGVESVTQMDDKRLHWVADVAGQRREWFASITEQEPDMRIAWKGEGDIFNAGVVTFHRIDDARARVTVQMEWQPGSLLEKVADFFGIAKARVHGDLVRFKEFVEERGVETGAWRGRIEQRNAG